MDKGHTQLLQLDEYSILSVITVSADAIGAKEEAKAVGAELTAMVDDAALTGNIKLCTAIGMP